MRKNIETKLTDEEKVKLIAEMFRRKNEYKCLRIGQTFDHVLQEMFPKTYEEFYEISLLDDGNPASKIYYQGTNISVMEYIENYL